VELYLHSPNTPPWRGAQLKHRGNFTFYRFYDKFVNLDSIPVTIFLLLTNVAQPNDNFMN
jgi:hypothetical protein